LAIGRIGKKASLTHAQPLGPSSPASRPALAGRVTLLHFLEPGTGDGALACLKRIRASRPEVSIVGLTFFSGSFVDPTRGEAERTGLEQEAETKLLLDYREAHGCPWPWMSTGRWNRGASSWQKFDEDRPRLLSDWEVSVLPTIVVVDRTSTIRYVHVGDDGLVALDEVVERLLAAEDATTRPVK
jgi:hypothetical protein